MGLFLQVSRSIARNYIIQYCDRKPGTGKIPTEGKEQPRYLPRQNREESRDSSTEAKIEQGYLTKLI